MVASEARYLGTAIAVVLAIGADFAVVLGLGRWAHLGPGAETLLTLGIGACIAAGFVALTFRPKAGTHAGEPPRPRPVARIVPTVLDAAVVLYFVYRVGSLSSQALRHEPVSRDELIVASAAFALFAVIAVREARQRWLGWQPRPSAFTQRRLGELEAAYAQPTLAQYRRAIAPLRNRGLARLGILVASLAGMLLLAPWTGIGFAFLIAIGAGAGIFLVLHKLVEL